MNTAPLRYDLYKLRHRPGWILLCLLLFILLKGTLLLAVRVEALGLVENGFAFLGLSSTYALFPAAFLLCIMAAASLSGEYAAGILRMTLTRPVSRASYFFSRSVYWALLALLILLADSATGVLMGGLGFDFTDVADPALQGPQFAARTMAWTTVEAYLLTYLGLVALTGTGLLISVLFKTPTSAMGAATASFFLLEGIRLIFREPAAIYTVTRYTREHLDQLTRLAQGVATYQPPGAFFQSLSVPLAYILITHGIAYLVFRKTDILE